MLTQQLNYMRIFFQYNVRRNYFECVKYELINFWSPNQYTLVHSALTYFRSGSNQGYQQEDKEAE